MVKDGKDGGWPWEALGAGLGSVLLFYFLTLRFRLPTLIGLGASLTLSSLVFLGVHRVRKLLDSRPKMKLFSLKDEVAASQKACQELKASLKEGQIPSRLHSSLEDLAGALELMASALEQDREPEVFASFLRVHQTTALRLARLAHRTTEEAHLDRIRSAADKLAQACRRHYEKVASEGLLEVEAELEMLETSLK